MGYSSKVGSFNIDTAKTVGQDQAVTGVGFTPKIVLFWWSGSTATGDEVAGGNINIGFGAGISSSSRFFVVGTSDDGGITSDTYGRQANTACIYCYSDGDGTIDGIADFKSLDADGFTLTITDQFSSAYRISYLALGGTDLTNVFIGNKQRDADAGNCSVTGVGFKPDAIITSARYTTVASSGGAILYFSLGMATGSSNQGIVSVYSQDGQADTNNSGYGYNGEVSSRVAGATSVTVRDSFVSFDDDGFTLNQLEDTNQLYYYFVALKGGQYSVGDITTRTDGNDIAETVGFQPVALLFASANRALSTQNAATDHARLSIGAATSTSNRAVQAISDEDALADSETAHANYDSAVYANILDDAIVGLMDLKSIESDGFTCVMDDTDPAECWVTYLAIGATAGGGGTALGTANLTLANFTLSASGSVINTAYGTADITLANFTVESAGTSIITGALDKNLAAFTVTSAGSIPCNGSLDKTLANFSLTSTGSQENEGEFTRTLANFTLFSTAQNISTGSLSKTLDAFTLSSTAQNVSAGSLTKTLSNFTLSAAGSIPCNATLDKTLSSFTLSSTASTESKGTLDKTLASFTLGATGTVSNGPSASLDKTLDAFTLISSGTSIITGALDRSLAAFTLFASGSIPVYASLDKTLDAFTLTAAGAITSNEAQGTLNATLQAFSLSADGDITAIANLDKTLDAFSLSSAATLTATGTLTRTLDVFTVTSSGVVSSYVTGTVTWGQTTGVLEDNARTFSGNWTGTGDIEGSGDDEKLALSTGDNMVSEIVNTGAYLLELKQNNYGSGDSVTLEYRQGTTADECGTATYAAYSIPFICLGFLQLKVTSTL